MSNTPSIFFLLGDSRSGTTFLAKELTNNYKLLIPPESNFIMHLLNKNKGEDTNKKNIDAYISTLYKEDKFVDWHLDKSEIKEFIAPKLPLSLDKFINQIIILYENKNKFDGDYVGIKKGLFAYLDRLILLFPQMKLVGVIRDGRAVFASQKNNFLSKTNKPFETSAKKAAKYWVKTRNILREFEQKYPQNTIIIKYEELVNNLDMNLSTLGAFFDLEKIVPSRDTYYVPSRYNKIHKNVGKKPIGKRISAWQEILSEKDIKIYERIARKTLLEEGYKPIYSFEETKKSFFFL